MQWCELYRVADKRKTTQFILLTNYSRRHPSLEQVCRLLPLLFCQQWLLVLSEDDVKKCEFIAHAMSPQQTGETIPTLLKAYINAACPNSQSNDIIFNEYYYCYLRATALCALALLLSTKPFDGTAESELPENERGRVNLSICDSFILGAHVEISTSE